MKTRLLVARNLLNPEESVLICTIDEKEYIHLGALLEELFPESKMTMISSVINVKGVARESEFSRVNEYIYVLQFGTCAVESLQLSDEWLGNVRSSGRNKLRLGSLLRSGSNSHRNHSPGCFYPLYFNSDGKFISAGDPIGIDVDRTTVSIPTNMIAVWPIHQNGTEGVWQYSKKGFEKLLENGFVYFGKLRGNSIGVSYAPKGVQDKIKKGYFKITGYNDDGSAIIDDSDYVATFIPGNQWAIPSHNSTEYGTKLIQKILLDKRFDYPKSLYAVCDTLSFFIKSKPKSTIVDFFAGSGTTLHAINLLNAMDGGQRNCIMVTNNEVSEDEAKILNNQGFSKGDEEWERRGIAKHVTWPRTECVINGVDIKGNILDGVYLNSGIPMSIGFNANVKYFKCDWTPRKPENYLLSNALLLHIKEMIEIQNAIEVDNIKNVILYNKEDYNKYILDSEKYANIQNVWVNQNIIFDTNELRMLQKKNYKYIPREFFGQELKEAAE